MGAFVCRSPIVSVKGIFVIKNKKAWLSKKETVAHFCGTVVITSNVSCLPETGGSDSVYVNPLQVEDIRAKILHLWNNEEERKRRADKSLEFVQEFNDEHIAKTLIKVYKELI